MKSNRKLRWVGAVIVLVVIVLWLSTSPGQVQKKYQVETRVYSTPEYRTDAARAIDAYERVMERYMDVAERNFAAISGDLRVLDTKINAVDAKLTAVDAKLTKLDMRLERIERHLGTIPTPVADPNRVKLLGPEPTVTVPATGR